MKKQIEARYLTAPLSDPSEIPFLFRGKDIEYHPVDVLNWAEQFPYLPEVSFAIAHCPSGILLHFKVSEQSVRAVTEADFGRVWEDSTVEFFSSPSGDGLYYNVECTCVGKLLVAVGSGREGRENAPREVADGIRRWASLGKEPFGLRNEPAKWQVALVIPLSTYFKHEVKSLRGMAVAANFYKCGDLLPVAHFATWNPVGTASPDYHRPEFFGTVNFE